MDLIEQFKKETPTIKDVSPREFNHAYIAWLEVKLKRYISDAQDRYNKAWAWMVEEFPDNSSIQHALEISAGLIKE